MCAGTYRGKFLELIPLSPLLRLVKSAIDGLVLLRAYLQVLAKEKGDDVLLIFIVLRMKPSLQRFQDGTVRLRHEVGAALAVQIVRSGEYTLIDA